MRGGIANDSGAFAPSVRIIGTLITSSTNTGQWCTHCYSCGNIDSVFYARAERELRSNLSFVRYKDSAWQQKPLKDTNVSSFEAMIPALNRITTYDRTLSQINNAKANISLLATDYNDRIDSLRRHWIEWNRKFTLSVACLVLFMIGAPLGSIIRKGGLGTPLIFAIVFFVLFHLLNTFGEKAAKSGAINVFSGMWLSTLVLIPIGAFLTIKAMRDSQLFNKEAYYRLFKTVRQLFAKLPVGKKINTMTTRKYQPAQLYKDYRQSWHCSRLIGYSIASVSGHVQSTCTNGSK